MDIEKSLPQALGDYFARHLAALEELEQWVARMQSQSPAAVGYEQLEYAQRCMRLMNARTCTLAEQLARWLAVHASFELAAPGGWSLLIKAEHYLRLFQEPDRRDFDAQLMWNEIQKTYEQTKEMAA